MSIYSTVTRMCVYRESLKKVYELIHTLIMEHSDVFYFNSFLENACSDLLVDVMAKIES